jgi:hypothetical protein
MVLLHDVDQVEARFGPFVDSVIVDARQVHSLWNVQYVWKSFWTHRMELLRYVGQVELFWVDLEMLFISVQDRWMVCAKCTIGLEIFLGAPNGSPS